VKLRMVSVLIHRFLLCTSLFSLMATAQTIRVDLSHPVNTFVPNQALGAGIDRLSAGAIDKVSDPDTVKQVLSAGWGPVTYRQNTELYIEDWHWNPNGTWSDPSGKGYFTGSTDLGEPIRHSYGYWLPHRGYTRNDGVEGQGYSRMTDGDTTTYWKSNPYLTRSFTGEDDAKYPQWVIVDLANQQMVNAIRIAWAEPYARKYVVQYWTADDPIKKPTTGTWVRFPGGSVTEGKGGVTTLQLTAAPVPVQFVRILMTESSNTCDSHGSADRRNCVGYAISELYVGTLDRKGEFQDLIRHVPEQDQTTTYCSTIDPWHQPSDLDPHMRDQVGLDLFYTSGYTRGLPAMIPVSVVYGIPEDAAAEIGYLQKRKYPISYVEMGEEPDGQYMVPEDYAALYIQFADAIHKVDPKLKLGGPVYTGVNKDIETWPDVEGRTSWTGRFVDYLRAHNHLQDLAFFPFEHYPFEPCKSNWGMLYQEADLVSHIVDVWHQDGVPKEIPLFITESNLSWVDSEAFVDTFGALWLGDYVGAFLTAGGKAVYYFHYPPMPMGRGCNGSSGTFGMFRADANYKIQQPISQYFASQLINLEWVQPGDGEHRLFRAEGDIEDPAGHKLVTAYALQRPDGQTSLLLINKDQLNAHTVHLQFSGGPAERYMSGPVQSVTFGSEQYQWHPSETGGNADPDGPAARSSISARSDTGYMLPKASMTVIRGKLAAR
jgi:F5/8 type C domain